MTHATTHTITGFAVDGILFAVANVLNVADVNAWVMLVASAAAAGTAVVRLWLLIKKGGKDE